MRRLTTTIAIVAALVGGGALASAAAGLQGDTSGCPTSTTPTSSSTGTTTPSGTNTSGTSTTATPHPLNQVIVENCYDDTKRARSKLQVGRVHSNDAQPENVAYAYAHDCSTGCQAIAAAFQVVLIDEGATVQKPQNYAIAINQNCTGCGAFAFAYQYALDVPPGTRLTVQTHHEIAQIRDQATDDVQAADVSTLAGASALDSELWSLAWQLKQDVYNGLVSEHAHPTHGRSTLHKEARR
jgi:hypothetical protein